MKNLLHTDSELPADIIKTVAYFDLFNYPVTSAQIYSFLPRNSVAPDDVARTTDRLVREGKLAADQGLLFLPSSDKKICVQRHEAERAAQKMLSSARLITLFLKRIPFIRGVFITGSLSKSVAALDSDIDFMIVTLPGRLWIVRSMLTFFRKVFLLGNRKYFCTNYYVTENGFPYHRRNLYSAIEVVTTKAVWNADAFHRYQQRNDWTKEFLPNMSVTVTPELLVPSGRSIVQIVLEFALHIFPLRLIDRRLMNYHRTYWNNAFGHVNNEQRNSTFIIDPDVSASWPDDRQAPVLSRYQEKLTRLGLQS